MKRSELATFEPGSAAYVVAHSVRQYSRGKKPSMAFQGELNPRKALELADQALVDAIRRPIIQARQWEVEGRLDAAQELDIYDAVRRWCNHKLVLRSSYYTGRGVNWGDLNTEMLEQIYQGLKAEVGQQQATNFVNFVNNLQDLSASAFIQSFEQFWYGGCKEAQITQSAGSGFELTGRGDAFLTEAFCLIGSVMGGKPSAQEIAADSARLKMEFIRAHKDELVTADTN